MDISPKCWIVVGGSSRNEKDLCLSKRYLERGVKELRDQIKRAVDAGYTSVIVESWFGFVSGLHKPFSSRRIMTRANTDGRFDRMLDMRALSRELRYWTARGIEVCLYNGKLHDDAGLESLLEPGRYDNWLEAIGYELYPALNNGCSLVLDAVYAPTPGDAEYWLPGLLRSRGVTVYTEPWPAAGSPEPPGGDLPAFCLMSLYDSYRSRIGKPDFPQYIRPPVGAEGFVVVPIIDGDFDTAKRQARRIRKDGFGVAMTTWRVKAEDITQEVTR